MKIGERGQVTIPKRLRQRLGLEPGGDVDFEARDGVLILRKRAPSVATVQRWVGGGEGRLKRLGVATVDELIERLRGR